LGGEVRAADAALWLRATLGDPSHRLPRVAPILAIEIAGRDEDRAFLGEKAQWYLDHGVEVVWLLYPGERSVQIVDQRGSADIGPGGSIPEDPRLPGLAPALENLFRQIG